MAAPTQPASQAACASGGLCGEHAEKISFDYGVAWKPMEKGGFIGIIDSADIDQFLDGEQQRAGGAAFAATHRKRAGQASCPKGVLHSTTYHCAFGPEDHTTPEAIAAAKAKKAAAGKAGRTGKIARGESQKVGCKAQFTITVYTESPENATIRYQQPQHTGHAGRMAPCLSEGAKTWLKLTLMLSPEMSTAEVQHLNQQRFLHPLRAEHDDWSEEQVGSGAGARERRGQRQVGAVLGWQRPPRHRTHNTVLKKYAPPLTPAGTGARRVREVQPAARLLHDHPGREEHA
jgi:hypothetical protein